MDVSPDKSWRHRLRLMEHRQIPITRWDYMFLFLAVDRAALHFILSPAPRFPLVISTGFVRVDVGETGSMRMLLLALLSCPKKKKFPVVLCFFFALRVNTHSKLELADPVKWFGAVPLSAEAWSELISCRDGKIKSEQTAQREAGCVVHWPAVVWRNVVVQRTNHGRPDVVSI